ncbi:MAG: tetrahydrofolate dehydrogenase/cyclohydrolase catalytic domain-containing protein [Bacteroidota bacterium]|nr:tetrahydrofolate dehydrogenase/cyclohydrolase catalytic domain-containing protein [Bacteroidota bacterium]
MDTLIIKDEVLPNLIFTEVKADIASLKQQYNKTPGIAFIGFGDVPLAKYVIPLHVKAAQDAGFRVVTQIKPDEITEEELFDAIDKLNANPEIDAILVLQPLPSHLNPLRIINRVNPDKEVEGFHPLNMMATLMPDAWGNKYTMCLPGALEAILQNNQIALPKDAEWVLLLDNEFIENPLVRMVARTAILKSLPADSSVTFANKNSVHLIEHCKRADVLVVVTKSPEYVRAEWLKPGVFIIDIYSNLVNEIPSKKDPSHFIPVIRGGVNVESIKGIASGIIPIPGGLMTIVLGIFLKNATISFRNRLQSQQ